MTTNDPTSEVELMGIWAHALEHDVYGRSLRGVSEDEVGTTLDDMDTATRDEIIGLGWLLNKLPAGLVTHQTFHPFGHAECQFDLWTGMLNMIQFSSAHGHTAVAVFPTAHTAHNAWELATENYIPRDIEAMRRARNTQRKIALDAMVINLASNFWDNDLYEDDAERVFGMLCAVGRVYARLIAGDNNPTVQSTWDSAIGSTIQGLTENLEIDLIPAKKCKCGGTYDPDSLVHVGNYGTPVPHRIIPAD